MENLQKFFQVRMFTKLVPKRLTLTIGGNPASGVSLQWATVPDEHTAGAPLVEAPPLGVI